METKKIIFVTLIAILCGARIDAQIDPWLNIPFDMTSLTSQMNTLAASVSPGAVLGIPSMPAIGSLPIAPSQLSSLTTTTLPVNAAAPPTSLNPSALPTYLNPTGFPMPTQGLDLSWLLSQINFQGPPKQIMNKLLPAILKLQADVQSGKVDSKTLAAEVTSIVDASMPFLNNAPKQVQTYISDIQTRIATIKTSGADPNQINAIIQDFIAISSTIMAVGKKAGNGITKGVKPSSG